MVRITEYYATASRIVQVPRKCSNCGGSWMANFEITEQAKAESQSPKDMVKAKQSAEAKVESSAKQTQKCVHMYVLCPICNHFCVAAMKKFFPDGYAKGILKRYFASGWMRVIYFFMLVAVALGLVAALLGGAPEALDWSSDGSGRIAWIIMFPVGAAIAGGAALWNLWHYVRFLFGYRGISKMTRSCTDDELLSLAIKCYEANNESLSESLHWIKIPLQHKTGSHS